MSFTACAEWILNAAHLDLSPSGNQLQEPKSDVPVLGQAWGFLPVGCCDGLPGHFLHSLACPLGRHATLQLSGSSSHTYAAICPLLSWEVSAPPKGWRIQKRKSQITNQRLILWSMCLDNWDQPESLRDYLTVHYYSSEKHTGKKIPLM